MERSCKVGVIVPAVTIELDSVFLDGIYRLFSGYGYDVAVFTCASNAQGETFRNDYISGEEKIYTLAKMTDLDGILFAGGRFHDQNVADSIFEQLRGMNCPCVCTDYENDLFPNYHTSQSESVRRITEHLISHHGFRNIICLTGIEGNRDAEERLEGWRTAMREAGLNDEGYFYGDFWKARAIRLADEIADGVIDRPEAVVCTSDIMAITLCDRLMERGIRVPEDIAVTGYDGGQNALLSEPSLTTVNGKEYETGRNAAAMLLRLITNDDSIPMINAQTISFGRSCGCENAEQKAGLRKYYEKIILDCEWQEIRMMSDYINRMASADSFEELSHSIDELCYIIPDWKDMYVCICPELDNNDIENTLPENFTDRMSLFVSKHRDRASDLSCIFDTAELIPPTVRSGRGQLIVVTPLHNSRYVYGYIATTYTDAARYVFDDLYIGWRDSVTNALSIQFIKTKNRLLNNRLAELSERDTLTGLFNLKGVSKKIAGTSENYALVILQVKWIQTPSGRFEFKPDIFISNAIQMNCSIHDICFRYNETVFGVFLPVQDDLDPKSCCDEWTGRFDLFVDMVIKQNKWAEKPVIRFTYEYFQDSTAGQCDVEQVIELHLGDKKQNSENALNYAQQLDELRRRIRRSPELEWSITAVSDEMRISESHFRKIYKQQFGTSFHADLVDIRMSNAMKLLKKTDMSINVIASKCGYKNVYHFMAAFKKQTGMTAKKYRDQAHK